MKNNEAIIILLLFLLLIGQSMSDNKKESGSSSYVEEKYNIEKITKAEPYLVNGKQQGFIFDVTGYLEYKFFKTESQAQYIITVTNPACVDYTYFEDSHGISVRCSKGGVIMAYQNFLKNTF